MSIGILLMYDLTVFVFNVNETKWHYLSKWLKSSLVTRSAAMEKMIKLCPYNALHYQGVLLVC